MSRYEQDDYEEALPMAPSTQQFDSIDSMMSGSFWTDRTGTDMHITFDSVSTIPSEVSTATNSSRSSPLAFRHHSNTLQHLWRRYCRSCFYLPFFYSRKKMFTILLLLAFCFVIVQLTTSTWHAHDGRRTSSAGGGFIHNLTNKVRGMVTLGRRQQQTINEIESKLRHIEVHLKQNRYKLNEIREKVLYTEHQQPKNSTATTSNVAAAGQCSLVTEVSSDLEMEKIYDQVPFDNLDGGVWKQGWDIQLDAAPASAKLKVFVMPHSHNDPGWIKTFDKYFFDQTRHILDEAVKFMTKNRDMKFIWAEISYLSAWWETTTDEKQREAMRQLIRSGQLEIVTGGWVMNDEANTHYASMLMQMIEGHEWLTDHIGGQVVPRHGWAIDPFGLSPTMAYLLKAGGFRAMTLQRVHYSIKKYLAQHQQLEFNWRQHWEADGEDILAHVQPFYSYDVPHTCGPDPKVCCQFDFKRMPPNNRMKCPWKVNPQPINEHNVQERATTLLEQYRKKAKLYRTNSVLVPLGDDFRYDKQKEWDDQYNNYKMLFDYINNHEELNVEIKFATLADYFDSLHSEATEQRSFPSLTGDFFTYCDRDDHYWSGYFTSKPFFKRFERILATHVRATEILFAIANLVASPKEAANFERVINKFIYARQNLALFQHHDGITGTAKAAVMKDYATRMYRSFLHLEEVAGVSLKAIGTSGTQDQLGETVATNFSRVQFMDRFRDDVSPLERKVIQLVPGGRQYFALFNSLGWTRTDAVYCFNIQWEVDENEPTAEQSMPAWILVNGNTRRQVEKIQINRIWSRQDMLVPANQREVCFETSLPPMSLTQFCVGQQCQQELNEQDPNLLEVGSFESFTTLYGYQAMMGKGLPPDDKHILSWIEPIDDLSIGNDRIKLHFDGRGTGYLRAIEMLDDKLVLNVTMDLMTYGTRKGGKEVQKSGAYIFLPDASEPVTLKSKERPRIRVTVGRLEERYELIIKDPFPIYLRWSLTKHADAIDFTTEFHLHGGLYTTNKELLVRYNFDDGLDNGERFYTDLNGFQLIARKRYEKIPVQGNVFPMATMGVMESNHTRGNLRFSLLTAQPLGVSSPRSGVFDTFFDRRLNQDDARGLAEAVTDNKYTRESFKLLLERPPTLLSPKSPRPSAGAWRESLLLLNPITGLNAGGGKLLPSKLATTFLKHSLPCDVHLIELRRATRKPNELALLLHRFGVSCDSRCEHHHGHSLASLVDDRLIARLDPVAGLESTGIFLLDIEEQKMRQTFNQTLSLNEMDIVAFKMRKL